jgi:hypothetical protein
VNYTVQFIYSRWKDWVYEDTNAKYLPAFRQSGGDPLTPGINAGTYFFLRNDLGWRIKPPEENIEIFLDGNLAPEDAGLPLTLPTVGAFSTAIVGLQPITQSVAVLFEQQKITDYRGRIYIDTLHGAAGINHPVGTASLPVNNFIDALSLSANLGFETFIIKGILDVNLNISNKQLRGVSSGSRVNLSPVDIGNVSFQNLIIQGDSANNTGYPPEFIECTILDLINVCGLFNNCILKDTLTFTATSTCLFNNCSVTNPDEDNLIILDFNSESAKPSFVGLKGFVIIRNMTHPGSSLSINISSGGVIIDSSCTDGSIFLSGIGTLVNNGNSTLYKQQYLEVDVTQEGIKKAEIAAKNAFAVSA